MEALESQVPPWIPEYEELSTTKAFAAGSLLHGPLFPAQASDLSVHFKPSGAACESKLDTLENFNAKRKVESAYGLFCVTRKRSCRWSSQSTDNDFCCPANAENTVAGDFRNFPRSDNDFVPGKFTENPFDLQGADMVVSDFDPRYICLREIAWDEILEEDSCLSIDESIEDSTECSESDVISEQVFKVRHLGDELTGSESFSQCDFVWPDADAGSVIAKSSSEIHNSALLPSANRVNKEDGMWSKEAEMLTSEACTRTSAIASPLEAQYTVGPLLCSSHGNYGFLSSSEPDVGSPSSAKHPRVPVLCEKVLNCRLYSEDPEIPCNSDLFVDDICGSSLIVARHGDALNMTLFMEKGNREPEISLAKKDDDPIPIEIAPPLVRSAILPEPCSLHQIVAHRDEYVVHDGKSNLVISATAFSDTLQGPSKSQSVHRFLSSDTNLLPVEDSLGASSSSDVQLQAEVSPTEDTDNEPALYQEEFNSEENVCFPDIEAMICRLNLLPDDSDACLNREERMSKHLRGTLLRLEHCTRASMRRAISSRGAFAILYGRDSKYYIKKTEVILGRSSDHLDVDIDLGTEGHGNKISRHQALVKLDEHGSFSLKNLGKSQIRVNGRELGRGQIIALTSSSLIEIKGITFVFKINEEAVGRFLKNKRLNKDDDNRFRWSEETL